MLRALVAVALLGGVASAEDAEDPKTAIAERGLVLKAGKRNFFVVVPPVGESKPAGARLYKAKIYFGDAKTLYDYSSSVGQSHADTEERSLADDPRFIYTAALERVGDKFQLACNTTFRDGTPARYVPLMEGDRTSVAKASVKERPAIRMGYFLARLRGTTTYLYLDRRGRDGTSEMRLLLGKRGALKAVKIKELADDATTLVVVTAKGVLSIKKASGKLDTSATWGPTKKPAEVDVLPIMANRMLVYQELGIYTREPSGHPCEEL